MCSMRSKKSMRYFVVSLCVGVVLYVLSENQWLCEDSLITLRSVDNFHNNYGLTWNPSERVQVR